jgi:hypothetical protein
MATFLPKSVFISACLIALGALSLMSAVSPLIPVVQAGCGRFWRSARRARRVRTRGKTHEVSRARERRDEAGGVSEVSEGSGERSMDVRTHFELLTRIGRVGEVRTPRVASDDDFFDFSRLKQRSV